MLQKRGIPLLAFGVLLLAACGGERTTLQGATTRLSYDCGDVRSAARTPQERALVREYAVNATRDARDHSRLSSADSIIRAHAAGDQRGLERAVVRYVCAYGDVRAAGARRFPETGTPAPDFTLTRFAPGPGSERIRLGEHRGRIVVLSFWATWCAPCRKEMPELQRVADRHRGQGVVVYGILHEDDPVAASKWMAEHGITFPLLVDGDRRVADVYRVRGLPNTYIIGRDGRVLRRMAYIEGRLEAELAEIVAQSPA